jgi:hypothetical protein
MTLGATALAQIALGGLAGASMAHAEISASIQIQSQVSANISISDFAHPIGVSLFASHGMADAPRSFIFASNNKGTTLGVAVDTDDLSITVTGNISSWPTSGAITLDVAAGVTDTSNEIVYYDGRAGQVITLVGRGKDGTTSKSFMVGSQVRINPIAETHNLLARTLVDVEETVLAHDTELDAVAAAVAVLDVEVDSKLPLAGGTMTGAITLAAAPTLDLHAATKRYVDEVSPGSYNVKSYGLAGDGTTDDTAALQALIDLVSATGGARIYFPPGTYLIGGAFQDTSGRNAQILLPIVATSTPPVTIELLGALAPPRQYFHDTELPSPTAFSIIKSTITGGSGTACFIGGIEAEGSHWNNVQLIVRDLIFEAPPNPSFTAFNCFDLMGPQFSNVLIHTGSLRGLEVTEPTNTNAISIRLAPSLHSAGQKLNVVDVWGFYAGMLDGELAESDINIWNSKIGVLVPFTFHLSTFRYLGLLGCQRGIVAAGVGYTGMGGDDGTHYMRVIACAVERGSVATGSALAWQERIWDVDDQANLLKGDLKWLTIMATSGNDHSFTKNGGTGLLTSEIGT